MYKLIDFIGLKFSSFPLSFYKDKSFLLMRNDTLDRFGTRLEKRFSKEEIETMMKKANLNKIEFYNSEPYWIAIGFKNNDK